MLSKFLSFISNPSLSFEFNTMMTHRHVLAIGVFDLFHVGHLRYLQFARSKGSRLSVGVTPDDIVLATKHKLPVIPQEQRVEMINGLGWVDAVKLLPTTTENTAATVEWMQEWDIDHVVVGGEWLQHPRWMRLIPVLAERNISVSFAPHTDGISSTKIQESLQQADAFPKQSK